MCTIDSSHQFVKHCLDVPEQPFNAYATCVSPQRTVAVEFHYNEKADTEAPVTEFWVQYKLDDESDENGNRVSYAWRTHEVITNN
jgi:hypothetical protein